jgi:polyisoprenoid-binding protein YceI
LNSRYRFDPARSRFTVQAFSDGLLSFLGHSPTFAVRDFAGGVEFVDDLIAQMRLEVTIGAKSLAALGDLAAGDRREIEGRAHREVLESVQFPEVCFRGAAADVQKVEAGRYRMALEGTLTLRGVTRPYRGEAELAMFSDGLRLRGETGLHMSEFGIAPVTALAGTLRLKDAVKFVFDLAAFPDPQPEPQAEGA